MPINCDSALESMIQSVPNESAAIDQSVEQIEDVQDILEEKNQVIRKCITDKAEGALTIYLEGPKFIEIQSMYPDVYIVYGPTYGTISFTSGNITDWEYRVDIIPEPPPPDPTYDVVYSYSPGEDIIIDGYVSDYAFGNDYITHPVGIGASYGLEPLVAMYEQGKATILGNKAKLEASIAVFEKYL